MIVADFRLDIRKAWESVLLFIFTPYQNLRNSKDVKDYLLKTLFKNSTAPLKVAIHCKSNYFIKSIKFSKSFLIIYQKLVIFNMGIKTTFAIIFSFRMLFL